MIKRVLPQGSQDLSQLLHRAGVGIETGSELQDTLLLMSLTTSLTTQEPEPKAKAKPKVKDSMGLVQASVSVCIS